MSVSQIFPQQSCLTLVFLLLQSKLSLLLPHLNGLGFVPTTEVVDDGKAFITKHPLKIIARGEAQRIPILMGHTSGEGIMAAVGKF